MKPFQRLANQAKTDPLVRNSLLVMMTTLMTSGLGYLFWVVAAHTYTTQVVGLAAALVSVMGLMAVLGYLGAGPNLIEQLPRQHDPTAWTLVVYGGIATGTAIPLVGACVAVVVLPAVSSNFAPLTQSPGAILALVLGSALMGAGGVIDSVFVAQRSAGHMLVRNAVACCSRLLLLVAVPLIWTDSTEAVVVAWSLSAGLSLAIAFKALARFAPHRRIHPRLVIHQARRAASRVFGHQLIGLGGLLPPFLLPLLVTMRLSPSENAYFYVTWMLGGAFFLISPAVATALFSEGIHLASNLHERTRLAAMIVASLLVPCMIVLFVGGDQILSLFGESYPAHGSSLLRLLVLVAIPDAVTNLFVSVQRVRGRLRRAAVLNISMAVGALALSWLLLPSLGIVAVGWAWLSMQTAGALFVAGDAVLHRMRKNPSPARPPELIVAR